MHNIDPLIADLKIVMEEINSMMSKFAEVCQLEKSFKKTHFFKTKHALTFVEKRKTQVLQLIRRFTETVLQIVSARNSPTIEGPYATDWHYALECVDTFNKVRMNFKDFFQERSERSDNNSKNGRA